jgi:hypothetical protein
MMKDDIRYRSKKEMQKRYKYVGNILRDAKFLSKPFITFALRLSCLRTNNELSLGELMHLK